MTQPTNYVLITGGSGLIGSALVRRLSDRYHIVCLDIQEPNELPSAAEFLFCDLTSDASVTQSFKAFRDRHGAKIASVLHLAAYYDFSGEPSPLYEELTVRGTERLLKQLHTFSVEQFVFSSTMLVHAPCEPGQRIYEEWPLHPKWDYPQSKMDTEKLIREQRTNIPAAILRIAGVYDDVCHSVPLSHQIQRIRERRLTSQVYPGNPECGQTFVHLDDLVDCFARVVDGRHQLPEEVTLLVGEPETISYGELQKVFGRLLHQEEWSTRTIPKPLAKAGAWIQDSLPLGEEPFIKPWMIDLADDHYEVSIDRARKLVGWQPAHRLRSTIPSMISNMQSNPYAWYKEHQLDISRLETVTASLD